MSKALVDAFPEARRTFEEADEALGYALSKVCFEGPDDALRRTETTQPALLTAGIAAWRVVQAQRPGLVVQAAAGHSLGEWTAAVAVGALEFADAVRLVRERGRLMQEAVPVGVGAMVAVLNLAPDKITAICAEVEARFPGQVVRCANFNSPEQTVISGHAEAVKAAAVELKAAGALKCVDLPVSAPFHSPLMEPAQRGLAQALGAVTVRAPTAPIVTNVEATPTQDPETVRALLLAQITAPVRWIEVTQALARLGVTDALELGAGKVLQGLVRRIEKDLKVQAVDDPASLEKLAV